MAVSSVMDGCWYIARASRTVFGLLAVYRWHQSSPGWMETALDPTATWTYNNVQRTVCLGDDINLAVDRIYDTDVDYKISTLEALACHNIYIPDKFH
jgi:hypothetical protein